MDLSFIQATEVDSETLSNVVIIPMTVASGSYSNVPFSGAAERRQNGDGSRHFLSIFGLEDAPGSNLALRQAVI